MCTYTLAQQYCLSFVANVFHLDVETGEEAQELVDSIERFGKKESREDDKVLIPTP